MNREDIVTYDANSDLWQRRFCRDSRDVYGVRFQTEPKNRIDWWAIGSVLLGIAVVLLMVGRMS